VTAQEQPLDLYLVVESPAHRDEVLAAMAELRRRGLSCDADYAGRSTKGQLTQAQRRAARVVIRTSDGWTLRTKGEQDRAATELEALL
jgi:histidyl-tRNA synthetase